MELRTDLAQLYNNFYQLGRMTNGSYLAANVFYRRGFGNFIWGRIPRCAIRERHPLRSSISSRELRDCINTIIVPVHRVQ